MNYPATFTKDVTGGYTVTFRDIPEAITQGDDYDEAIAMAQDCLITALSFYTNKKRLIPTPSDPKPDDVLISLPVQKWLTVLLFNELVVQKVAQNELASRMGIAPQQVNRLLNFEHNSKIDTFEQAFLALGRKLTITLT